MDVTENVSLVSMSSHVMNRLGLSKDSTDADRNLIGEELCKAAEQSNVPCSKVLPKLSLTFLYDNVDSHILPESSHCSKSKLSTKSIFTEYAKFKVCASCYHHYIHFL